MQDWYLMTPKTKPNSLGGFENQAFHDFKQDAFYEALETDIATTVMLYKSDLSEGEELRCIVEANLANTQLKSLERNVLCPIGTVKAGMYILFEGCYWLIHGYPGNNGIFEKFTIVLCQYLLRWQDDDGNVIERWINATSASKYDIGENGFEVIKLSSNNFTLLLPDDDGSLSLDGRRVFIDRHTSHPTKVFKITRSDDILYLYGEHGGVLSFIADKDEYNESTDNQELRICDYQSTTEPPSNEQADVSAEIIGNSKLKVGYARTYSVVFTDKETSDIVDRDFSWNIVSDFELNTTINGDEINIRTDNANLIGRTFRLRVIISGTVIEELSIKIVSIYG